MRPKKQVKLADIAEKLGTSVVSVSNALAGRKGVSEELRARAVRCAKEMGYPVKERAPGAEARILVLTYENEAEEAAVSLAALRAAAAGVGYELERRTLRRGGSGNFAIPEAMTVGGFEIPAGESSDGFTIPEARADDGFTFPAAESIAGIIFAERMAEADLQAVCEALPGVPAVGYDFFDCHVPIDYICDDGFHGIGIAYRELYRLGHRDICLVTPDVPEADAIDRYLGFLFEASQHGQCGAEEEIDSSLEHFLLRLGGGGHGAEERRPTAALCTDDKTAAAVLREVRKLGIRVPDELSVTGYRRAARKGSTNAGDDGVDLTSVICDERLLAEKCVDTIRKRAAKGNEPDGIRLLIGTLHEGATTAPPPGS